MNQVYDIHELPSVKGGRYPIYGPDEVKTSSTGRRVTFVYSFGSPESVVASVDQPIPLSVIQYRDRIYDLRETIFFPLQYSPDDKMYSIEYDPIGISVFAKDKNALMYEIAEQFDFLWEAYACEEDENLSPRALELKENLLELVEGIVDAEK